MRQQDNLTVLSALAFGWHGIDAIVHRNSKSKTHKILMGVGLGWSGFWLAINLLALARKEYQEAKYTPPGNTMV